MRIILGLGNPGPHYARSRHNVGFLAVESLASRIGVRLRKAGEVAEVARGRAFGDDLVLARPLTFMNLSGRAAEELAGRHGAGAEDFIVVYDDVALPLGRLRLRSRGSSGGHKGMESVIERLGTREIPRLRLGILGAEEPGALSDYVLRDFEMGEWPLVTWMLERSCEAIAMAVQRGVADAASRFNRMAPPSSEQARTL